MLEVVVPKYVQHSCPTVLLISVTSVTCHCRPLAASVEGVSRGPRLSQAHEPRVTHLKAGVADEAGIGGAQGSAPPDDAAARADLPGQAVGELLGHLEVEPVDVIHQDYLPAMLCLNLILRRVFSGVPFMLAPSPVSG